MIALFFAIQFDGNNLKKACSFCGMVHFGIQKNFDLFFMIRLDMQATQLLIKTGKSDKSAPRIILSKVVTTHAVRRNVT